jgi:hypothetical protein
MTDQEQALVKSLEASITDLESRLSKSEVDDEAVSQLETQIEALTQKLEKAELAKRQAAETMGWDDCVRMICKRDSISTLLAYTKARQEFPGTYRQFVLDGEAIRKLAVAKAARCDNCGGFNSADADECANCGEPMDGDETEGVDKVLQPRDPPEQPVDLSDPSARDGGAPFLEAVERIRASRSVSRTDAMRLARKEHEDLWQAYNTGSASSRRYAAKSAPDGGKEFLQRLRSYHDSHPGMPGTKVLEEVRKRHPQAYLEYQRGQTT